MSTKFSDFFQEIVEETKAEGKQAVEELKVLREVFQQKRIEVTCKALGHDPVGAPSTTHVWCQRCDKYLGKTSDGL